MASPQYQALVPEQQAAAQEQYFNEVVAPRAGDKAAEAKAAFFSAYPTTVQQQTSPESIWTDPAASENNDAWGDTPRRTRGESLANDAVEAAKGLAQTAVSVANIPGSVVNTALSAVGVPEEYQVARISLPESMQPSDSYAKLGAEIGPYLIPGIGAGRTAAALGSVANAGRLERLAIQGTGMLAENLPGALAQTAGSDRENSLAENLSTGVAGSALGRGVVAAGGVALRSVKNLLGREGSEAAEAAARAAKQPGQGEAGNVAQNAKTSAHVEAKPSVQTAAVPSEQAAMEDSLRSLANNKKADIASTLKGLDVQPKQDVIQSAKNLGVDELLLPSHYSGNAQYQAVEQAIKSRKGSALKVQEDEAILGLANSAGKMIDDVAQMPDALAMNEHFVGKINGRMTALENKSDQLYAKVESAMPARTPVEAPNTAAHLERQADELGGWENLDSIEQRVFKAVNPGPDGRLTYANLNKQRRMVGQALFKKSGPYKDAEEGALKGLYRQLSEDQRAVLGDVGSRRDFEVAQRLVQMRKSMEDQMVKLRGKNLTGDITTKATAALSTLAKGSSRSFRELMMNIPSREMRTEIIGTALRDMLSSGKRGADFNPGSYADWYQNLMKTGNIRQLEPHLTPEIRKGLRDLYNVADGIRRAKLHEVTTGALNEFTGRFNRITQEHEMAAKYANKVGVMVGAKVGPLGAVVGDSIGTKLAARARIAGGSESAEAAEKLILSPEFQKAFKTAESSSKTAHADIDTALRSSPDWKSFYETLPDIDKKNIARVGVIGWLADKDEDN